MKTLVIVVLLLAACGAKQKAGGTEPTKIEPAELPTGPITFDFALAPDMKGQLALHGTNEKDGRTTELRVDYPIATQATSEGIILEYGEPTSIETPGLTDQQRAMLLPMITAVPTVVVNDGAVTKIHGFEEFRARLDELLAPTYEKFPMMKVQMSAMMTPEFFLASAQEEWMWRGQAFHGRTLEVGASIEEETELPMMLSKEKLPAKFVMTFAEVLRCPGAPQRACVRLERELVLDPIKSKEAMSQFGDAFDFEKSTTSTLIADAETLLPYRFEKNESARVSITRGEQVQEQMERKHTVENYTW